MNMGLFICLSALYDPGWHTHHGFSRRNVLRDNGTGSHNGLYPHRYIRKNDRAGSNVGT